MKFYADLHVHSRFSRATSRDCRLEQIAAWAMRKGLSVVGTGDFTHPAWRNEIRGILEPAEPGLYRLKEAAQREAEAGLPASCRHPVRFALQGEVSTIYKKGGRTRKVHHVVLAPDFAAADRASHALARIGNVESDGRPILGLDSRDLLEIVIESGDGACLIPAHIWTPWFSALGSMSGFDSIADCYGDLADRVFAVETGLSSDPPMNWRLSVLDRYRLVSNSDAHSPAKLGREACVFDTEMTYFAMLAALQTGRGYGGTVEFFPEEGKYHLDGHRKCGVCLSPEETRSRAGVCPACGKKVTVGVMSRVHELADRPDGAQPPGAAPFTSRIPLHEVVGEILGSGPASKTVCTAFDALLARLGPELLILNDVPLDALSRAGSPVLAEAISRMRAGKVIRQAGYDGDYGVIRVFEPGEIQPAEARHALLLDVPPSPSRAEPPAAAPPPPAVPSPAVPPRVHESAPPPYEPSLLGPLGALDPDQRAAAEIVEGPLLIVAGPGTGKTRTLTHRIAHLIAAHGAAPERCLTLTFTRRAAGELRERLARLVPDRAGRVPVTTFHGFGHQVLREFGSLAGLPPQFRVIANAERRALLTDRLRLAPRQADRALAAISAFKCSGLPPAEELAPAVSSYDSAMRGDGLVDFDDLVVLPLRLLAEKPAVAEELRERYRWISVDEYQDIAEPQYRLVRILAPAAANLCAIGDPDQAIYGFRGSNVAFFQRFAQDYPSAAIVRLGRNYRSSRIILSAATQAIAPSSLLKDSALSALLDTPDRVTIHRSASDAAEAEFVVHTVERMIGGAAFFSMDSGRAEGSEGGGLGFSDFAVLFRTAAQADTLEAAFARSGMPCQRRSHAPLAEAPAVLALLESMQRSDPEAAVTAQLAEAAAHIAGDRRPEAEAAAAALAPMAARARTREEFRTEIALASESDLWDPRAEAVSLLTLHASKGLEFPVVFVVGCEEGILPLGWGATDRSDLDEERRLLFVGMTRARQRLFLCHAARRHWRGALRSMRRSPFLDVIEEQLVERSETRTRSRPPAPAATQLNLF